MTHKVPYKDYTLCPHSLVINPLKNIPISKHALTLMLYEYSENNVTDKHIRVSIAFFNHYSYYGLNNKNRLYRFPNYFGMKVGSQIC